MDTIISPAFAAFGGSAFGAISTIVTGWVSRRRRLRERHYARSISNASGSIEASSRKPPEVYADALVSDKSEIPAIGQPVCAHRADEDSVQRSSGTSRGAGRSPDHRNLPVTKPRIWRSA